MIFPIGNPIVDKVNEVRNTVAPVTKPVGDAFGAAVEKVESGARAAADKAKSGASAVADGADSVATAAGEVVVAAIDGGPRPLEENKDADQIAKRYFGDSVDFSLVELNESSALVTANQHFNNSARPFVWGNTINFDNKINFDDPAEVGTFLHEMTHVWQFQQTGVLSTGEGVVLAGKDFLGESVYSLDDVPIDPSNPESFLDLTTEQQAEVVRGHYYLTTYEDLTGIRDGGSFQHLPQDLQDKIDADIATIEGEPRFRDLTGHERPGSLHSFSGDDLQPFIDLINDTEPKGEIFSEVNEALLPGGLIQGEGLDVGLAVGKAAVREVGDGIDFVENAGEDLVRRLIPARPFGL